MWKYVTRRVKDTIDLGINVRKSFTVQNALNHHPQQQQNPSERKQNHNNFYNVVPRYQDPSSRDKERQRDEKFKKKYYRLHQDKKCFLNALTWSAALITGFYASQLVCLYRRNQRLGFDVGRCYYSKYVLQTSHAFHRNAQRFLLTPDGQRRSIVPKASNFGCPFKKSKRDAVIPQSQSQLQSLVDNEYRDLLASDPGYKQYERFFFESPRPYPSDGVFNVNHKPKAEATKSSPAQETKPERELSAEEKQDEAIDSAIRELAKIVGELEYQLGVDSMLVGNIEEAIDHFIMSTNQNHPGGIFNLALCYEQGLGVKKNMKTARKLYEMASELGHAKASYNLGVFHAQGLGGQKSRLEAKKKFEQAAALGSTDAIEALRLLLPVPKKLPVIDEFPNEEFYFNDKMMIPTTVSAISNNLRRIAAI